MHRLIAPLILILILILTLFSASLVAQDRNAVVLISIDGFMPDYFERTETPNYDLIIEEGVLAD